MDRSTIYVFVNLFFIIALTVLSALLINYLLPMGMLLKAFTFVVLFFGWGWLYERKISKYVNGYLSKLLKE